MSENNNLNTLDCLKNIQVQTTNKLLLEDVYAKYNTKRTQQKRVHLSFIAILCISIGMQALTLSSLKKQSMKAREYSFDITISLY
jgi:hypothetical protein